MVAEFDNGKMSHAERRAQWQAHVEAWRRSGESAAAYGRSHGLKPGSLYRWNAELAKAGPVPRFIPLRLPAVSQPDYAVELNLADGRRLRIATGADPVWVGHLLRALEGAC